MKDLKKIKVAEKNALDLVSFRDMDYFAVENYALPIELMMENAGLQLANLVASTTPELTSKILIGVGNGNNGGGGLVAARRLAAWGYEVHLDFIGDINRELPVKQLERALAFGAKDKTIENPDIWIDAYLGFSQRLPLRDNLIAKLQIANNCNCQRISLDIPTGFLGDLTSPHFHAHKVLSLAAAKKILYSLPQETELYIADLGIPKVVYQKFEIDIPPFQSNNILQIER